MRGLYIHVPFCNSKCPYCDFYSLAAEERMEPYTEELIRRLRLIDAPFDTVYFGGGTPSLLGAERLCRILSYVHLGPGAEVTLEANPGSVHANLFYQLQQSGFNRLSLGLQSANPTELRGLGRSHTPEDAVRAVHMAQDAGFTNISLDLMVGIPGQTEESLSRSIAFCADLRVQHISSYLLKLEEGTAFYQKRSSLILPDEDTLCALYLAMVEQLAQKGYSQYEISNFCRPGLESRHNLKYWRCQEYLGLGPAAHAFWDGQRSYFPRDLDYFLTGGLPITDGTGGTEEEQLMLRLRLTEGVRRENCPALFDKALAKAAKLPQHLILLDADRISLTTEGILVSNSIIAALLDL